MHVSTHQNELHLPLIGMALIPTIFPGSSLLAGPKHSTSVPFSAEVAVLLSVDEKEVAVVPGPNPVPGVTVKILFPPIGQQEELPVDKCAREHRLLLPFTIQMLYPILSPVTVQLKVNLSPGQVGGAAVNCAATLSEEIENR